MTTAFKHPLARTASVWETGGMDAKPSRLLVIVTTLQLDKAHKSYKGDKVERLAEAAKSWIQENGSGASDFVLMNRPKDWP